MTVHVVILAFGVCVLAVWVSRHVILSATRRTQMTIRPGDAAPLPDPSPKVSIVVPAKDEEANIAACIETLLAQDYPDLEIIIVDDRSTDRTAGIVRDIAAAEPRVRLVQVAELPPGWFGKPHAMSAGARDATGEWLWFVDADCRQAPGSLRAAMAHTLAAGGDMLSLWPLLEMKGFAENLVQPLCGSILGLYFRPQRVNDPKSKAAFANGQFVLVRRSTYEAVGGHASVRDKLVEDISFARVVKGAGHRLLNAVGFDVFHTRMYDSFAGIWRGWTRIFSGAWPRPWPILLVALLVVLVSASPFVLTAVAGAMAAQANWADAWLNVLAALGAAQLAVMATVLVRYCRMIRAKPVYLLLYPVSILIVLGILLNALAMGLGLMKIRWRGTTYHGGTSVGGSVRGG